MATANAHAAPLAIWSPERKTLVTSIASEPKNAASKWQERAF